MKKNGVRRLTAFLTLSLMTLSGLSPCIYAKKNDDQASVPSVSAEAAVLMEAVSGDVIFEKNSDKRLPMASTTKIMTALVAIEKQSGLDYDVKVASDAAGVEGSSIYLKAGETITMESLLYALLLESANDAAAAIAYEISGGIEPFAELMNETAERIGLQNTHFMNPHGLDDEQHYTTAHDLAKLTSYALKNEKFREIVSTYKKTIPLGDGDGTRLLLNHNKMLRIYDNAIGVKTGFTKKSGRCLVSAAERDGVTMVAVTLKAPDDWNDHEKMLDYGFSKYSLNKIASPGQFYTHINCIGGDKSTVRCSNRDELAIPLPIGTRVTSRIEAERYFPAPINSGDALARVIFSVDGEEIASAPLYSEEDVALVQDEPGVIAKILRFFGIG